MGPIARWPVARWPGALPEDNAVTCSRRGKDVINWTRLQPHVRTKSMGRIARWPGALPKDWAGCIRRFFIIFALSEIALIFVLRRPPSELEALCLSAAAQAADIRYGALARIAANARANYLRLLDALPPFAQRAMRAPGPASWRRWLPVRVLFVFAKTLLALFLWLVWTQRTSRPSGMVATQNDLSLGVPPPQSAGIFSDPFALIQQNSTFCMAVAVFLLFDGIGRGVFDAASRPSAAAFESSPPTGKKGRGGVVEPQTSPPAPRPTDEARHQRWARFALFSFAVYAAFAFPLPRVWRDPNEDLAELGGAKHLVWMSRYEHPSDPKKLIKQYHIGGYGHKDFWNLALPIPYRYCDEWCPALILITHQICLFYQMVNMRRIVAHFGDSAHYPKVYEFDPANRRVVLERAELDSKEACAAGPSVLERLRTVNGMLERANFHLDDSHAKNWMWSHAEEGGGRRLLIIDGELYSPLEYMIAHPLVQTVDLRNTGTISLPGCPRCWHWMDGPRLSMKQIMEGVAWWPTMEVGTTAVVDNYAGAKLLPCRERFLAEGGRAGLGPTDRKAFEKFDRASLKTSNNICALENYCQGGVQGAESAPDFDGELFP